MRESQHRFLGLACIVLLGSATFAACGSLDPRKVTRGPEFPAAGGEDGEAGNGPGPGPGPDAGGSSSMGGEMGNPFGGQLFVGGAPPVLDGPPEVLEVDPVDAASDVEPTGAISLLFSEGLAESSVTTDSIKIMDGTTDVAGDVSYSGVVATFEPARRLSLLASYDISVSQDITDVDGTPLKEAFASSFKVRDGRWSDLRPAFENSEDWANSQEMAMDGRGNTLVVFGRSVDGVSRVFGRWYRASTGWQDEVILDDGVWNCSTLRVDTDASGDAIVAWYGHDVNYQYRVFARRFVNGVWEETPQDVTGSNPSPFLYTGDLRVAIEGGHAVVSWVRLEYQPDPFAYYYYLNLLAAPVAGSWPADPTQNFSLAYTSPNYDQIVGLAPTLDAAGNAIVTFGYTSQVVDPNPNYGAGIYYTRKAASGDWQYPSKIPDSTSPYLAPVVASDGDGAMSIWTTYTAPDIYRIWASRYTKAKQFIAPQEIGDPDITGYIEVSRQSLASNGSSFYATWLQDVGSARNAYVSRFDIATGEWDALPTFVSDGVARAGYTASIGVDAHGNALVAFDQEAANNRSVVMFARLVDGEEWAEPELLSPDTGTFDGPLLSVAPNGIAAVLFRGGGREGGDPYVPPFGGQFRFFD